MDWSRLGATAADALVVSFISGALLSPPDPFTQVLYVVPTFLVAVSALWLYGDQSVSPWWRRYLRFVGSLVTLSLAWQAVSFAVGLETTSGGRTALTLAGVAFAVWVAYFGGLARLRRTGDASDS
ncbi:DUF7534 family protein [Halorussus pelagicus]|uniref:DUF7534 family protein n=1 Tax=Halorussus pelagicus TaxID=2505977 RepID=UPI000FFB795E|nr:hypothetical protein [Halorussus pelagicus]